MKKLIFAVVTAALAVATISRADGVVRFSFISTGFDYDYLIYDKSTGCSYYRAANSHWMESGASIIPLLGSDGLPSCNGQPIQTTSVN